MTDSDVLQTMHPSRRAEDQRFVARIASSPWAAVGQLAGMLTLAVTVLGSAFWFYGEHREVAQLAERNKAEVAKVQQKTARAEIKIESIDQRTTANREAIKRVEAQAQRDREAIIDRLERMKQSIDQMGRYLRDLTTDKDSGDAKQGVPTHPVTRTDESGNDARQRRAEAGGRDGRD